jgi:hypothetical protein
MQRTYFNTAFFTTSVTTNNKQEWIELSGNKKMVNAAWKVAKQIGRIGKKGLLQEVNNLIMLSDGEVVESIEFIIKSLLTETSLLDDVEAIIRNLTGWNTDKVRKGLYALQTKNIIELRQCVQPYQVIPRF